MNITRKDNSRGLALVTVLLAMALILLAMALLAKMSLRVTSTANTTTDRLKAEESAKAGIDIGIEQYWNAYWDSTGLTTSNLTNYRAYLDDEIPTLSTEQVLTNASGHEISEQSPLILTDGTQITLLTVRREDDITGSNLIFRSRGTSKSGGRTITRTATQTARVSGAMFQGAYFAIMANNITCIVCHTEVLSVEQHRNTDSDLYGSFDRVKIAALESLMVRTNTGTWAAATNVAGTTYTRGRIYDHRQNEISASQVAATSFDSYPFSGESLHQTNSGDLLTPTDLIAGVEDGDGVLEVGANLYIDYPTDKADMTDGELPTVFPAPFIDLNENRLVDDVEFAPYMNAATGSLTGGVVVGVPDGSTYSGASLPTTSSPGDILAGGSYDGNIVLVGTEDNPIILNGDIAINGDLVISGVVQGKGKLQVRGNTYIVGDVTYDDAAGEFGQFSSDASDENLLAITSGGNIMLGDYNTVRAYPYDDHKYTNRWGQNVYTARDGFYSYRFGADLHIDYRNQHVNETDRQGDVQGIGYFDDVVDDGGLGYNSGGFAGGNPVTSFTTGQLMLFNRMEHAKALADPDFVPRYYQLREGTPIYEYLGDAQHTDWYDNPNLETISGSELAGAAILGVNPANGWFSEDQLRQIWYEDEISRNGNDTPFRFDGLLYSNNAIFAEVHSERFHNSNTQGKLVMRGGIIAPDLGILIPGKDLSTDRIGFTMLYDKRVATFLDLEDTTAIEMTRMAFSYEN